MSHLAALVHDEPSVISAEPEEFSFRKLCGSGISHFVAPTIGGDFRELG